MFVTIRQVQANGKNLFQVESDNNVLFKAQTPWLDIRLPFNAEHLRQLVFTDAFDNPLFHTEYNILKNTVENLSQPKSLLGKVSKQNEYQIIDQNGTSQGSFYTQTNGVLRSQLTVCHQGAFYDCYSRALGKVYVISIFHQDKQIAQITKPLDTKNNLDVYYLHIEDASQALLPILSFFTIYVDFQEFHHAGEISMNCTEKQWSYTYDRYSYKYNPNWIGDTFGQNSSQQLNQLVGGNEQKNLLDPQSCKKQQQLIVGCMLAGFLCLFVVWGLLIHFAAR